MSVRHLVIQCQSVNTVSHRNHRLKRTYNQPLNNNSGSDGAVWITEWQRQWRKEPEFWAISACLPRYQLDDPIQWPKARGPYTCILETSLTRRWYYIWSRVCSIADAIWIQQLKWSSRADLVSITYDLMMSQGLTYVMNMQNSGWTKSIPAVSFGGCVCSCMEMTREYPESPKRVKQPRRRATKNEKMRCPPRYSIRFSTDIFSASATSRSILDVVKESFIALTRDITIWIRWLNVISKTKAKGNNKVISFAL